jgi:hypothetical protein
VTGRSALPRAHRQGGRQPTRRGAKHLAVDDPANPGCCLICHRPTGTPNDRHIDQLPTTDPAVTAAEARRLGERDPEGD